MSREDSTNTARRSVFYKLSPVWVILNAAIICAVIGMIALGGTGVLMQDTLVTRSREAKPGAVRTIFIGGCVEREGTYELPEFSNYGRLYELAGVLDCSAAREAPDALIDFSVQALIVHRVEDGRVIRARNINAVTAGDLCELGLSRLDADRVIAYRENNGRFVYKEQLCRILDEREYDEIKFMLYAL